MYLSIDEMRQRAFEIMVRGLHSQGWRQCRVGRGLVVSCVWGTAEPRVHCAIGWLLRPTSYTDIPPDQQDLAQVHPEMLAYPELRPLLSSRKGYQLLHHAQLAHDTDPISSAGMRARFERLAEQEKLQWPSDVPAAHTPT